MFVKGNYDYRVCLQSKIDKWVLGQTGIFVLELGEIGKIILNMRFKIMIILLKAGKYPISQIAVHHDRPLSL